MQDCVNRFVVSKRPVGKVLDIGSWSVNPDLASPYREIFEKAGWRYVGLDLSKGSNVDIVASDPFLWPIRDQEYDAVISGQMMEHNSMFWLTFLEMARVLKPGGVMIHIAPSRGHEHRFPTDCWRFYRDGMSALSSWSGLRLVEATTDWSKSDLAKIQKNDLKIEGQFQDSAWGDTVGVFEKPKNWSPSVALKYMTAFVEKLPKTKTEKKPREGKSIWSKLRIRAS